MVTGVVGHLCIMVNNDVGQFCVWSLFVLVTVRVGHWWCWWSLMLVVAVGYWCIWSLVLIADGVGC